MASGEKFFVRRDALYSTGSASWKIFLYSYLGFALSIVRVFICLEGVNLTFFFFPLDTYPMCGCRSHGCRTFCTTLARTLPEWGCGRPIRSNAATSPRLRKVSHCPPQPVGDRKHGLDILFYVIQSSTLHTFFPENSEVCVLHSRHSNVGIRFLRGDLLD